MGAFYELLSHSSLSMLHPEENKPVAPVELCPILKTLYRILITRYFPVILSSLFFFLKKKKKKDFSSFHLV